MGTPGDKSGIKELEEKQTEQLEGTERDAETEDTSQTQPTATTPEMTILGQLPHFTTFLDYFAEPTLPSSDKLDVEEFYIEQKFCPPAEEQFPRPPKAETFPALDEPGPSGLQTPKSKVSAKVNIKRIKKSQSQKKLYTCQTCQKTFQNSNKLSKHQQIHGSSSPFKCEHCKKSFSSKFKLVRHVLIHSDRKPFSCSVCERTFHRKDHLKNHIKVHSPCKKLYLCEKTGCKKEYTSSLSYKKHLALHAAEEGILDCQICMKSFKSKEEILYHLKIHAGSRTVKNPDEKKYSCDHCQRKFFTRKDVKRHLVVHTGKRDFLCQFCPQRFGRKDHLVRHIKKSHMKGMQAETLISDEQSVKSEAGDSSIKSEGGDSSRKSEAGDLSIKSEAVDLSIKSEADESNLSNPEVFSSSLDLDSLLTENFPMLSTPSQHFLPPSTSQDELTDLGSEVLKEITDSPSAEINPEMFEDNLINDSTLITLLQEPNENLPLPAFSQIFQTPPQPPPK